jgi:hypothetical protein
MKSADIPTSVQTQFQYQTRALIFKLIQELATNEFLLDPKAVNYLEFLNQISDVGDRHRIIFQQFAEALCE